MKKIMHRTRGLIVVSSMALVLAPAGCTNPDGTVNNTGTGALIGGLAGAGAGALIGGRHHALAGALIGGAAGAIAGGLIGHMIDQNQQARLQAQSPQTWQTIQHNDQVAAAQAQQPQQSSTYPPPSYPASGYPSQAYQPQAYQPPAAQPQAYQPQPAQPQPAPAQPAPAQPAPAQPSPAPAQSADSQFTPITVDDIKALTAAGVKKDAITQEIELSKSTYTAQQVADAQAANPPIDPGVIDTMKSHPG